MSDKTVAIIMIGQLVGAALASIAGFATGEHLFHLAWIGPICAAEIIGKARNGA